MSNRCFSWPAIGLHLTLAMVVPTFVLLFLWQVRRATGGQVAATAGDDEEPAAYDRHLAELNASGQRKH